MDEIFWDKLIFILFIGMVIKLLDDNEFKLKNVFLQQIFIKIVFELGVLKSVVDEINKIDFQKFNDYDFIGCVYEFFLQVFLINVDKEEGEFYILYFIVEFIVFFIEFFDGMVYDFCCGFGGMFV